MCPSDYFLLEKPQIEYKNERNTNSLMFDLISYQLFLMPDLQRKSSLLCSLLCRRYFAQYIICLLRPHMNSVHLRLCKYFLGLNVTGKIGPIISLAFLETRRFLDTQAVDLLLSKQKHRGIQTCVTPTVCKSLTLFSNRGLLGTRRGSIINTCPSIHVSVTGLCRPSLKSPEEI